MASLADLQAERERLKAANAKAEFDAALAETCAGADLMAAGNELQRRQIIAAEIRRLKYLIKRELPRALRRMTSETTAAE